MDTRRGKEIDRERERERERKREKGWKGEGCGGEGGGQGEGQRPAQYTTITATFTTNSLHARCTDGTAGPHHRLGDIVASLFLVPVADVSSIE